MSQKEISLSQRFRYDSEHGRFTDPPSEYTAALDRKENHKFCESCKRQTAQKQVELHKLIFISQIYFFILFINIFRCIYFFTF